jgi:sugar phosphate isomerase/epimerase
MVAYGFDRIDVAADLDLARRLGAGVLEVLPDWSRCPDPAALRSRVGDLGLAIHSAHGCWGGQTIRAARVDLGAPDPSAHRAAVDDLKRCVDWLRAAGGACLVVHPGVLSAPEDAAPRRAALASGLGELADHARDTGLVVCVENLPPGVHPGSRVRDLAALVAELDRPELALALDTGHAHLAAAADTETRAAAGWLRTTHVHDNAGRHDTHDPPGAGTIDWPAWIAALDAIAYRGPLMLECIRHLRQHPEAVNDALLQRLAALCAGDFGPGSGWP